MIRWTARTFVKGLLAVLPIAITVFLLYWLASGLEAVLGAAVAWLLPESWYVPGMGLVVGLAAIVTIGVLLQAWMIRRIWSYGESLLDRVPLVRVLYNGVKRVVEYLSGSATGAAQDVVVVSVGDPPVEMLGFVTRDDFTGLPEGLGGEGVVAVYLPMSYQMGGFTVMIPRDRVRTIDMRLEEGLQFALTAGVSMTPTPTPGVGDAPDGDASTGPERERSA